MDEVPSGQVVVAATVVLIAIVGGLMKFAAWKGAVDQQTKGLSSDIKRLNKSLRRLRKEFRQFRESLLRRFAPTASGVAEGASPLRLTELGRSVSKMIDAEAWAARIGPGLREKVAGYKAYQIHDFCFGFIEFDFEPDGALAEKVRECAYEKGLNRQAVLDVMALELRDWLLTEAGLEPTDRPADD